MDFPSGSGDKIRLRSGFSLRVEASERGSVAVATFRQTLSPAVQLVLELIKGQ